MCKLCFHFPATSVAVFVHSSYFNLGYTKKAWLYFWLSFGHFSPFRLWKPRHYHYQNEQRIFWEKLKWINVFSTSTGQIKELRKISLYYLHSSRIFKKTSFGKTLSFFSYQSEWLHHFFYSFLFPAFLLFLVCFCYLPDQMTRLFFSVDSTTSNGLP